MTFFNEFYPFLYLNPQHKVRSVVVGNFVAQSITNNSMLPVCNYSLRKHSLNGPPVQKATIGEM
ncbi:hypothetical protein DICVIV_07920, partial [Dictyocaulus viviparus]